ncbi:MAG TPA: flagellar biosynthetic protein FliO [Gammaproteobacteria bacterium]|nr:flagellar biosynthetic protein FliO [Gammaproteobacteria bacterium]
MKTSIMRKLFSCLVNLSRSFFVTSIKGLVLFNLTMSVAFAAEEKTKKVIASSRSAIEGGQSVTEVALALALIIAVIFLMAWSVRRLGGAAFKANSELKVIGGLSMGARERIVLIQVGDEQLLLGVAPGRIQSLHVLNKPIQGCNSAETSTEGFADKLKFIIQKKGRME